MREVRALSPGKLGHGCTPDAVMRGMALRPDFIAVDAGSGDMGPFYYGSHTPFFHPISVTRDLTLLLQAARSHGIPLIIGNAITIGTNALVDRAMELLRTVALDLGLEFTVAIVRAEQDPRSLEKRLSLETIPPLGAPAPLTARDVESSVTIVAQMGVEPLIRALDMGADVVVAGRACDDALFAAVPVRQGFDRGLALHMGKILECGSLACVPGDLHGSLVGYLRDDHFILDPPEDFRICTVHSVAAETLYERANPYLHPGPGGVNDLQEARLEQLDKRRVRISGSLWRSDPNYKVKIEGVRFLGYRAICIAGIRDPILIEQLDGVLADAEADTAKRFTDTTGRYQIVFRQYGRNAVMGGLEPQRDHLPHEIGLLIEVIGETQDLADAVCMYVRGTLQHAHYPGIVATAGNLAYPFSPFTASLGAVYQFHIDHLVSLRDPCQLFPIEVERVGKLLSAPV
jgi:hypothetical protein